MKINIAFISPEEGIGGGNRKYAIYFKYLDNKLFNKYYITITNNKYNKNERIELTEDELAPFLEKNKIQFLYLGNKLTKKTYNAVKSKAYILKNVNFTQLYTAEDRNINLVISKTDYLKLKYIHKELHNTHVVYNPIDIDLWTELKNKRIKTHRNFFENKNIKIIIGRLGRAEPSKWNFLIIKTLINLQKQKNYKYGFIFAGMPKLYKWALKLLLKEKMKDNILFLPELKKHEDIARFYKSIDLFWQTSLIGESFGNVIAEAFCFEIPVLTDYKDFFSNFEKNDFRVNQKLYNAQSELVDHRKNGAIYIYPDKIINFLEKTDKKTLKRMGQQGRIKVKNDYDARIAGKTLAKILYEQLIKEKKIKKDPNFENITQVPSEKEVSSFDKEYFKKLREEINNNRITEKEFKKYKLEESIWLKIELVYLIMRKALIAVGIKIEK